VAREAVEATAAITDGQVVDAPMPGLPVLVRADRRRLAQILRNLLRNAITHTPAGGSVRVTVETRDDLVSIVVTDTGSGIPQEHLPLVFERFHRVDPSRARASGGMGLGLALVRELAAAMGGRAWAESEHGSGSRVGVELPAARSGPTINGPSEPSGPSGTKQVA
jgi:signal transduction histidine kinase